MNRMIKISIAAILISVISIFNFVGVSASTIYKDGISEDAQSKGNISNINDSLSEQSYNIVSEVEAKRDEFVKHYSIGSGRYIAVVYAEPVNYNENGQWKEIDNSLIVGNDSELGSVFHNKCNSYKATFSKTSFSDRLVSIQYDQYSISWSLDKSKNPGIKRVEAQIANSDTSSSNNDELFNARKSRSTIEYKSVFQNVDIKYTVAPKYIKEDIILTDNSSPMSYSFNIRTPGLKARQNSDNTIDFFNSENPGHDIFSISAPTMYDSSKEHVSSSNIEMILTDSSDGYILELIPDSKWINAPDRVFPIYIDPTTTVSSTQNSSSIADTYVHSGDQAGNHYLLTYLRFGNSSDGLDRTYIKINLPSISGGTVYDATMYLSTTSGSSTFNNIDVYRVDSSWSSSTITWSLAQTYSQTLVKSNIPISYYSNSPSSYRYSCNITDTVQEYYNGSRVNNGLMIRYTNESIADYNAIYSSDCGTSNVMPVMRISYVYGETTGIVNGGIYYIFNRHSNKCMDVAGAGTTNGTNVQQWDYTATTNQRWKAIYQGNGLYKLLAVNTPDKYLEVAFNSNSDGTNINIWNGNYTEQYWSIQSNSNGSFRILSLCSDFSKGATVENASVSNGANVFQYTYTTGSEDNDDWIFTNSFDWPSEVQPTIHTRSEWNARTPDNSLFSPRGIANRIVFHHSAEKFNSTDINLVIAQIKRIQDMHMDDNGWADIGYNFIIDPAGRIWQGRDLQYMGAHATGWNDDIGVVILGDFEPRILNPWPDQLNQQQQDAMTQLSKWLCYTYDLARIQSGQSVAPISTHRTVDPSTVCPGANAAPWIENQLRAIISLWGS
jgi:hypothetical protein